MRVQTATKGVSSMTIYVVIHSHRHGISIYTMSSLEKAQKVVEDLQEEYKEDFNDEKDYCEIALSVLDEVII